MRPCVDVLQVKLSGNVYTLHIHSCIVVLKNKETNKKNDKKCYTKHMVTDSNILKKPQRSLV